MLPARERGGEGFAEAENTFKSFVGGREGVESELEALETEDGAAVAFDDGGDAVPIGAAEVATDDEAFGLDTLHDRRILDGSTADTAVAHRRVFQCGREQKAAAGKALVNASGRGGWPLLMPRDSGSGRTRMVMANSTVAVGLLCTLGG